MKRANLIATACFTAIVGAFTLMNVHAQDFTGLEKSILTFSAPVELPGVTLQPGTYIFRRPDPNSARIIQVFTEDNKDILGTFLTVPTKRLEVTSENVVTFKEAREGMTPAVHYWYYPGLETGHEFVYPKNQAMKIAARTGERVMSTEGDINANSQVTPIEGIASNQADADASVDLNASAPAHDAAAEPSQQAQADTDAAADVNVNRQGSASTATPAPETQVAQNNHDRSMPETVGTSGQADASNTASDRLPSTASPLALSALIGLLSLGSAASLRRARARQ